MNKVVVGAQWGDEGKAKITDLLAADAELIIRYQGGCNAGHTVVANNKTYKFHLIPSGICMAAKPVLLVRELLFCQKLLKKKLTNLLSRVQMFPA